MNSRTRYLMTGSLAAFGKIALLAATLVIATTIFPLSPATASCAAPESISPPIVFLGEVESERQGYVRFSVSEVWSDIALAKQVWVESSSGGTSEDALDLKVGETFLVGTDEHFVTDVCQVFPASAKLPVISSSSGPHRPSADGRSGAELPPSPLAVIAVVVALASSGLVALAWFVRRRSSAR